MADRGPRGARVTRAGATPRRRTSTADAPHGATPDGRLREIPARPRPIARATEAGTGSVLKSGPLMLLSDAYGDVRPDRRGLGLYLGDTRVLSTAVLRVDGRTPTLLRPDPGGAGTGIVQLTNPEEHPEDSRGTPDHPVALPRQSVGIRRVRELMPTGEFRETLAVASYTLATQRLELTLVLDVDAADIFEVRGYDRLRRGLLLPILLGADVAVFRYGGLDGRELRVAITFDDPPDLLAPADPSDVGTVAARWSLELPPGREIGLRWRLTAAWQPSSDADRPPSVAARRGSPAAGAATAGDAQDEPAAATIETDDEILNLILARARADLLLLRTPGPGPGERFVAAGIPWFATLFGRDSLIAGYATLPYLPDIARDALRVLARLQATEDDPARDAEPGKILHELRTGEMAHTGELPFARYYGSVDATPLWLMLLSQTMAWTGDGQLVDDVWPAALRALGWVREHGPRDDDGFLVYRTRAGRGLRHQGWKDSSDSMRDRHGGPVEPPIALAEVQAYAVDARRRMASLARTRGEDVLAAELEREAVELARRFDERFWRAHLERYAMGLGPGGTVADALGSNMGHCLWAGAVPSGRATSVARSLTRSSLSSGWGVRTYGADQPGFNPLGYHTGSVWPHDTAIAAAGLKRYGLHEEASALAWSVLEAARRAPGFRLPELFCGYDRASTGAPVMHPVSCAPQAWAAGSAFLLVSTMLGLVADAGAGELEVVRPILPREIGKIVIRGLRVGDSRVDLLFHRWRGTTSAEVLGRTGDVRVTVRL